MIFDPKLHTAKPRLIAFDLDGTLLNTIRSITYYLNNTLRNEGIAPITEDECKIFIGDGAKKLVRRALLSKGISSSLRRNPNPNRKEGCNFALYVHGDVYNAFDILTKNGIRNLGVESFREIL